MTIKKMCDDIEIERIAACLCAVILLFGSVGCASRSVKKMEDPVEAGEKQLKQRTRFPVESRLKAVVLDFEDRSQYGKGRLGTAAANVLTTFLSRSGQFALYEREKLPLIYVEQKIKEDGGVRDVEQAVKIGKTLGVDYVITGVVSNFGYKSKRTKVLFLGDRASQQAEATVDVRMIEVATGRIIASESGTGLVTVSGGHVMGLGSSAGYDETIPGYALRAAISQYVDVLIDEGLSNR